MKPQTQYERILRFLRAQGRRGATTMELIQACGTVCPWKRIAELHTPDSWRITRTPEMRCGKRLTVYRLERVAG